MVRSQEGSLDKTLLTLGSFFLVDILDKVRYNTHMLKHKGANMRKVTAVHFLQLQRLMLSTTESYINCFADEQSDSTSLTMYADDVAYNINALVAFNASKDAQALHDSIMYQDTLVREYYISVLLYIERNKLIDKRNFCCS